MIEIKRNKMLYIKIEDGAPVGYPMSESTIREILSNISLPAILDPNELLTLGFAEYKRSFPPEAGIFQIVDEVQPEFDGTTVTQKFEVRAMTDQEKAGAIQQQLVESKAKQRHLLAQSDWTELPSVTAKNTAEWSAAWAEYRTKLRDLDKTSEWPFVSEWPSEPQDPLDVPAESV